MPNIHFKICFYSSKKKPLFHKKCEKFFTILNILLLVCIYSQKYGVLNINCAAIERIFSQLAHLIG